MTLLEVWELYKPDPDSHYQLKPCACGSCEVAYLIARKTMTWRVKCLHCAAETTCSFPSAHAAQIAWNTGQGATKP